MAHEPLKVFGYARVSTAEQARDGVSLRAQRDKIEQFCRLHELELLTTIEDPGASAKTLDRPGLNSIFKLIDAGKAGGLVVAKLDRLTRSLVDLGRLVESHFGGDRPRAQLLSVSDSIDTRTANGRMVMNLIIMLAQWERETIVERTNDAFAAKRSNGEVCGHAAYGTTVDPGDPRRSKDGRPIAVVPNPAELEVLALMRELADQGRTLRAICAELDRRGLKPRKEGGRWSRSTVHDLLSRHQVWSGPDAHD